MRFVVAGREHEPALRRLLAAAEMPGWVRLAYHHEPDLAASLAAGGRTAQVIAALDGDEVVGCGYRSIWRASVNRRPTAIGYLGGLRSLARVRGGTGLARGFRFLAELHGDGRAPAYLTTILEDNDAALELLSSGRAGLPTYRPLGRYLTRAVLTNHRRRPRKATFEVSTAAELGWDEIATFLATAGARRQFGPCPSATELASLAALGLPAARFLVARRGSCTLATAAVWDTTCFRLQVVCGYQRLLARLRPAVNLVLAAAGLTALPAAGERLRLPFLAFVTSSDDDPAPLAALVEHAHQLAVAAGWHGLAVGYHADDPVGAALSGFAGLSYPSQLFLVHWDDGRAFAESLEPALPPFLEAALL